MKLRDFIPGAAPARTQPAAQLPDGDTAGFLGRPAIVSDGTEYYYIRSLAAALNRTPKTIREWEQSGVIPRSFIINDGSRHGQRRLYTREQILLLRELAGECGILGNTRSGSYVLKGSEFSRLAHMLFDRLRQEAA
jgi:hypothetical protein